MLEDLAEAFAREIDASADAERALNTPASTRKANPLRPGCIELRITWWQTGTETASARR